MFRFYFTLTFCHFCSIYLFFNADIFGLVSSQTDISIHAGKEPENAKTQEMSFANLCAFLV